MGINFTNTLFILIIFQLLFLSCFLLTQKNGKRVSRLLLGIFFLSICLNFLDVFLLLSGVYFSYPALAGWGSCIPLLLGPLLFLYTQSVLNRNFSLTWKKGVHFIPFLIFFLTTELYYLSWPVNAQETFLRNTLAHHFHWSVSLGSSLIFIQFSCYVAYSLHLVSLYKKAAGQHFSDQKHASVAWLYSTMVFFMFLMVGATLNGLLARTALARYYLAAFSLIILAMLIFINRILLNALHIPRFLSFEDSATKAPLHPGTPAGSGSPATDKRENEVIAQTILQYMQREKPFLEPELTLHQLASRLNLRPKMLSLIINERLGQNFFDFINHYRIEEAKKLLTNPIDKKITVSEVLFEVGFNSKSSFNTLFKKYTGLTPTEFRKKQVS